MLVDDIVELEGVVAAIVKFVGGRHFSHAVGSAGPLIRAVQSHDGMFALQRIGIGGAGLHEAVHPFIQIALAADPEKFQSKGVASHRARVANLREFLPAGLSREECARLVIDAMKKRCASAEGRIPEAVLARAEVLAQEKYRSWDWTWGRSPRFTQKLRRRFPWGRLECLLDVQGGVIRSCRICGDFFALRDVEELEALFSGLKADPASLREALADVPVERWFAGAERAPLLALLCGETG